MLYFSRLEKTLNYFYLYSNSNEPLIKDFIFNLYFHFYKEAKEKEIEDYLIMKGFKILFFESLNELFFLDYKLLEKGEELRSIINKDLRKKAINHLFSFKFVEEINLDEKIVNWIEKKKKEKENEINQFVKELKDLNLRFRHSKDLLTETINLVKSSVLYSYLEKNKENLIFKSDIYKIKTQKIYSLKSNEIFAYKLFLSFPMFLLFDFPEKALYDTLVISFYETNEIEKESAVFNNFVENFANIIISNLKKDPILEKKAKDSEIELLKLI